MADPLACLLAALDLAEEAPRDRAGNLTPEGRARVRAALGQADGPDRFDDDLYHGPTPPGPGWVEAGTGPRGGKRWRYQGAKEGGAEPDAKEPAGLLKRFGGKIRRAAARVADAVSRTAVRLNVASLAPDILDTIEDTTKIWYRQAPPLPGVPLSSGQLVALGSHVLARAALFLRKKARGHAEGHGYSAEELPAVAEVVAAALAELHRSFPGFPAPPSADEVADLVRQQQEGRADAEPFREQPSYTTGWGHTLRDRYG